MHGVARVGDDVADARVRRVAPAVAGLWVGGVRDEERTGRARHQEVVRHGRGVGPTRGRRGRFLDGEVMVALRRVEDAACGHNGVRPVREVVGHRRVHVRLRVGAVRLGKIAAAVDVPQAGAPDEVGDELSGPLAVGGNVKVGEEEEAVRRPGLERVNPCSDLRKVVRIAFRQGRQGVRRACGERPHSGAHGRARAAGEE